MPGQSMLLGLRRLADRVERPPGPAPRHRLRDVKATPFGTRDEHDPERVSVLRPAPARAPSPVTWRPVTRTLLAPPIHLTLPVGGVGAGQDDALVCDDPGGPTC